MKHSISLLILICIGVFSFGEPVYAARNMNLVIFYLKMNNNLETESADPFYSKTSEDLAETLETFRLRSSMTDEANGTVSFVKADVPAGQTNAKEYIKDSFTQLNACFKECEESDGCTLLIVLNGHGFQDENGFYISLEPEGKETAYVNESASPQSVHSRGTVKDSNPNRLSLDDFQKWGYERAKSRYIYIVLSCRKDEDKRSGREIEIPENSSVFFACSRGEMLPTTSWLFAQCLTWGFSGAADVEDQRRNDYKNLERIDNEAEHYNGYVTIEEVWLYATWLYAKLCDPNETMDEKMQLAGSVHDESMQSESEFLARIEEETERGSKVLTPEFLGPMPRMRITKISKMYLAPILTADDEKIADVIDARTYGDRFPKFLPRKYWFTNEWLSMNGAGWTLEGKIIHNLDVTNYNFTKNKIQYGIWNDCKYDESTTCGTFILNSEENFKKCSVEVRPTPRQSPSSYR